MSEDVLIYQLLIFSSVIGIGVLLGPQSMFVSAGLRLLPWRRKPA
jgi:hypothetical protein